MMDKEKYEQEIEVAQKYSEAIDYENAKKHYKKALQSAPAESMQEVIDKIREMTIKAKEYRPNKQDSIDEDCGFKIYERTFADVIGYKRHKRLARRIIERPTAPGNLFGWFKIPKSTGLLLYGPPGTGKTLFAKALSGEFRIRMKDVRINEILSKMVGESEKNMAKVFEEARNAQPSILFFDELDALGASRESANEFTSNDLKNTINVFLKELSELHDEKEIKVFVIGATNLPWQVDDAIKRSGRIEHHIYIGPPSFWDRRILLKYYLGLLEGGNGYGKNADINLLALATARCSQADIEAICTFAFRIAEEQGKKYVTTRDIQKAIKEKKDQTLDNWYLEAKKTYLNSEKETVEKTGFLGLKRQKKKIQEQGKLNKDEQKVYKPLINNLRSTLRWWGIVGVIRFIARGF